MNRDLLTAEKPYLVVEEQEPDGRGGQIETTTVFLTAAECPIGCSMCDLYHNTLTTATPPGAVPKQIDAALENKSPVRDARLGWIKLYNSGNFFDPRSIPPVDYASIAVRCRPFSRVIVENHPRFGADRLPRFRDLIETPLEVAVGLETVQPRWLARMGKKMSRDQFDRYARRLRNEGVDLRVFLIVGVPGIAVRESIRWARLSARHAIACRARHISFIPARSGHGWSGLANQLPTLPDDALVELQQAAIGDADGRAAVTIDLWNFDPHSEACKQLAEVNLTQRACK